MRNPVGKRDRESDDRNELGKPVGDVYKSKKRLQASTTHTSDSAQVLAEMMRDRLAKGKHMASGFCTRPRTDHEARRWHTP